MEVTSGYKAEFEQYELESSPTGVAGIVSYLVECSSLYLSFPIGTMGVPWLICPGCFEDWKDTEATC